MFWPDDIRLMEAQRIDATRLLNTAQVSDSYLLALACAHEGQLASFDRRLVTDAVRGGAGRGAAPAFDSVARSAATRVESAVGKRARSAWR